MKDLIAVLSTVLVIGTVVALVFRLLFGGRKTVNLIDVSDSNEQR